VNDQEVNGFAKLSAMSGAAAAHLYRYFHPNPGCSQLPDSDAPTSCYSAPTMDRMVSLPCFQHTMANMETRGRARRRPKPRSRKGLHPTILDVAKAAGVSKTTVSNVMHQSGRFTPETESQVLEAIQRLGFRPNVLARHLVQQATTTVGVVVGALDNPFYAEMAMQIEREAASRGFHAMFCNTQGDEDAELWGLESYLDYRAAGIVFTSHPADWKRARALVEGRIPAVFVACDSDWGDVVRCDDEAGGRLATQHLVDLGHQRIAYFADPLDDAANRDRRRGYSAVMERARLRPMVVAWDRSRASFRDDQVETAIGSGVTAIFATDDYGAIELLDSADRLGIRIPEQLSVVGFDDLSMSALGRIALTTIHQPKRLLAQVAVATLVERISGDRGGDPVHRVVPVELAVRDSTAPPSRLT
jgi:LacI family transcriptional regulator